MKGLLKNNITLVSRKDFILNFFNQNYKSLLKEKIKDIAEIKDIRDYQFKKERVKLVRYKLLLTSGEKVILYGYASNLEKSIKVGNRYYLLKFLSEHGFGKGAYRVPQLLKFFPELNLLVRKEISGKVLCDQLYQRKITKSSIAQTAKWLAKFHSLPPPKNSPVPLGLAILTREFKHYLEIAKRNLPKKEIVLIETVYKKIRANLKHKSLVLTHGDFQIQNIFYNQTRKEITVMDFDWASLNDPMADVGNFLLQFDFHGKNVLLPKEIIGYKITFLRNYFKKHRPLTEEIVSINLWQARFAVQRIIFIIEFIIPKEPFDSAQGKKKIKEHQITISKLFKKIKKCLSNNENINLDIL